MLNISPVAGTLWLISVAGAGERSAARSVASVAATPVDSPVALALARGSADLKDEELARLLHEVRPG